MNALIKKIQQWFSKDIYTTVDNITYKNGKAYSACGLNTCQHDNCHTLIK